MRIDLDDRLVDYEASGGDPPGAFPGTAPALTQEMARDILNQRQSEELISAVIDMEYPEAYFGSMKTTIDIPEDELQEAIRHTGAKTKREAVVFALHDFNRRRRLAALTGILGTFTEFMTQDDLLEMRKEAVCHKRGSR